MWPWEHLAFAYVLYSLYSNVIRRKSPSGREAIAVVIGSQLPDIVDKPLAWTFAVTETGYSIGHSIFVAPVVCLLAYALASRRGERVLAGAFSIAYLSHLVADVINPWLMGRSLEPRVVLWPIASPPANDHGGLLEHFAVYFLRYVRVLLEGGLTTQATFQLGMATAVLALWLYDGAPIAADCWRWLSARRNRL